MTTARPLSFAAAVCLRCGARDPVLPAPECTHAQLGRVAVLSTEMTEAVARLRRALRAVEASRASLLDLVELEAAAGRAVVEDDSPLGAGALNVVHLRPRPMHTERDGSPVLFQVAQPAVERSHERERDGGGFALTPPEPKRRKR